MVHSRSSLVYTPGTIFCHAFSLTLTTMTLNHSSLRWFGTYALTSIPRGLPPSFVQLRTAFAVLLDTLERQQNSGQVKRLVYAKFILFLLYETH